MDSVSAFITGDSGSADVPAGDDDGSFFGTLFDGIGAFMLGRASVPATTTRTADGVVVNVEAAPATPGLVGYGGSIDFASLLDLGTTVAEAGATAEVGEQTRLVYEFDASQWYAQSAVENIRGRQEVVRIQDDLQRTVAAQNALYAARGGLLSSGALQAVRYDTIDQYRRGIRRARFDASMRVLSAAGTGAARLTEAEAASESSAAAGLSTLAQGFTRLLGRT